MSGITKTIGKGIKAVGKTVGKVASVAAPLAPFIPGLGNVVGAIGGITGALGGGGGGATFTPGINGNAGVPGGVGIGDLSTLLGAYGGIQEANKRGGQSDTAFGRTSNLADLEAANREKLFTTGFSPYQAGIGALGDLSGMNTPGTSPYENRETMLQNEAASADTLAAANRTKQGIMADFARRGIRGPALAAALANVDISRNIENQRNRNRLAAEAPETKFRRTLQTVQATGPGLAASVLPAASTFGEIGRIRAGQQATASEGVSDIIGNYIQNQRLAGLLPQGNMPVQIQQPQQPIGVIPQLQIPPGLEKLFGVAPKVKTGAPGQLLLPEAFPNRFKSKPLTIPELTNPIGGLI